MSRHKMEDEELDSHLPLLTEPERRVSRDDARMATSPAMSTVSTQSHEVKYIFEPGASLAEREADTGADYSHIHIRPKLRGGDGGGFVARPPPPAYHHRPDVNPAARFHPNLHGVIMSGNVQRFRSPPQALSLEDVSGYELSRRKSWSPPLLRQSMAGYHASQKNVRSCYSSNMVDWEPSPPTYPSNNPPMYPQAQPQGYLQGHLQGHPHGYPQGYLQGPVNSEETGECLPPRLAPVSGVPPEKLSRNLIRPIAFKPAYTRHRLTVCPQCGEDVSHCCCGSYPAAQTSHQVQMPQTLHHPSQVSQSYSHHLGPDPFVPRSPSVRSAGQSSQHSAGHGSHRSTGYSSEAVYIADDSPGENVDHSPPRKASAASSEVVVQTPSPSDSGVGELEAMLKEREAEILTLRQVMDRNERAIFQVYEEKKSRWLQDMQEIKEEYEHKLKLQQQKASKLEQALALQIRRLQQEKHQMQGKVTNLDMEREAAARHNQTDPDPDRMGSPASSLTPQKQSSSSVQSSPGDGAQQSSVNDELAMKKTEILALRSQLQTLQSQLDQKDQQICETLNEVESKTEELKLMHEQLDELSGVDGASLCEESTQTVVSELEGENGAQHPALLSDEEYTLSLERQIDALRQQLQTAEALVESERVQWLEEKNKVIRYQKQLQLNYVQMQRKNTALEAEVEQLTLELESRHLKLAAMNGEESVC